MNSTIELTVRNKDIHVRKADKLVTGQTNNEIKFHFDGEPWNSLSKSIIFRVEDLKMLVALDGDTVKIPFETSTCFTTPSAGATISFSIFMASRTNMISPALTAEPG